MLIVCAVVVLALAALAWPTAPPVRRLNIDSGSTRTVVIPRIRTPITAIALVAGLLAFGWSGIGGAFAAICGVLLCDGYRRHRLRTRRRIDSLSELAAALGVLIGELRAGAHPANAARSAESDAAPRVARLLGAIAAACDLGSSVSETLLAQASDRTELTTELSRLARCWELAERHGVAIADLLRAVRDELDHRTAFLRELESNLAAPRATACVLAGLPVLGVLLGQAIGADPVGALTDSGAGQALLVVGTLLLCAGARWTIRLTESAVRA